MRCFALLVLGLAACPSPNGGSSDSGVTVGCPECTVFINGRVFDGEKAIGTPTIVVRGGKIEQVVQGAVTIDAGMIVDLTGKTLLPGLIDLHTHVRGPGGPEGWRPTTRSAFGFNFKQLLRAGVTSFVDLGASAHTSFTWRQRIRDGRLLAPRMFSAGSFLEPSFGGHCTTGLPIQDTCVLLDAPSDVIPKTAGLLAQHPDLLKVTVESGHAGYVLAPMTPATIAAVVGLSKTANLPLLAHVGRDVDFNAALDAGATALTHMPIFETLSDATVARIVRDQIAIVPTLVVVENPLRQATDTFTELAAADIAKNLAPEVLAALRDPVWTAPVRTPAAVAGATARWNTYRDNFSRLVSAGALILFGTDAGTHTTPFGLSQLRELELMVASGMSPTQVLAAATRRSADFLRHPELGRIEPNASADLLVVRGDPLANIAAMRDVDAVYLAGARVDLDALALDLNGSLLLQAVTGLAEGSPCLASTECVSGVCNALEYCGKSCTAGTECSAGEGCVSVTSTIKQCITGDPCAPTLQNCPNGANCVPIGHASAWCMQTGAGADGDPCSDVRSCRQGHLCVGGGVCREMCNPASPVCPTTQTCVDQSAQAGVSFGLCQP